MEHLRRGMPAGQFNPLVVFPLLEPRHCRFSAATGDNFHTFPHMMGYDRQQLSFGNLPGDQTLDEAAPFLQQWLFWGLLESMADVAELPIVRGEYIREGPTGRKFISTEPLTKWLRYWILKEIRTRSAQESELCRNAVVAYLDESAEIINALAQKDESSKDPVHATGGSPNDRSQGLATLLLCSLLGEAIKEGLNYAYSRERLRRSGEKEYARPETKNYDVDIEWKPSGLLIELLLRAGWCISDLQLIVAKGGGSLVSRMCLLGTFRRGPRQRHEKCTAAVCSRTLINPIGYVSTHLDSCKFAASADHKAEHVFIQERELQVFIEEDQIPLITFESGKLKLQPSSRPSKMDQVTQQLKRLRPGRQKDLSQHVPVDAPRKAPYVAISHVWSHGFGNPHANSLPQCRLGDIQRLVDALYPRQASHVPFWMDTMCIPSRSESPLKARAVSMIHRIYRDADKVLVLDNGLMGVLHSKGDPTEVLARVQYSAWAHRLWTFQEGALANKLFIQLQTKAVQIDDLFSAYRAQHQALFQSLQRDVAKSSKEDPDSLDSALYHVLTELKQDMGFGYEFPRTFWPEEDAVARDVCNHLAEHAVSPLYNDARRFYTRLRSTREPMPKASLLAHCIEEIKWRSTSRPSDEVLCLAILLDMDIMTRISAAEFSNVADVVEEKMARMLIDLKHVPLGLIFSNLPRMQMQGFRWAPKSYINQPNSCKIETEVGEETAVVECDGLGPRLILCCPAIQIMPPRDLRWPSTRLLYITMHGRVYAATILLETTWDCLAVGATQFCIILRKQFVDSENIRTFASAAALVAIVKGEPEITHTVFKTALWLEALNTRILNPDAYTAVVSGKSSISRRLYRFSIT